jgi:tetratricopeptide (TPR) repeat protein
VQAHLHFVLASTYAVLNESQPAKRHVEAALALDRQLYGELHPATANAYAGLGWIHAGHLGDFVRGARLMDRALALYARMPAAPPEDHAEVLAYRSAVAVVQGELAEATAFAERAVSLARRAGPASPILPQALHRLGTTYDARGDVAAAEKAYREALAAFNRLPQPDIPERSSLEIDLGGLLVTRGQLAAAERFLRGALADAVRHLGPENPVGPILHGHFHLGRLAQAKGDLAAAEAEVRRGLAILEARGRGATYAARIGQLHLGRVLLDAGRHAEAERVLSEAHAFFRAASLELQRVQTEVTLGSCLVRQGRFADAEPMLLAAHTTFEVSQVPTSPRLEASVRALVELYERWGKPDRAASWSAQLAAGR